MDDVWKGLTLLIGTGVGIVAYQQFRLAREKFKLDLFEKRFSVFSAARRLLTVVHSEANVTPPDLFEYRAAVAEATFLFGQDITDYLDEIDKKALSLHFTNKQMAQHPPVENRPQIVEENHQLLTWLIDQLPELKLRFAPYMKFHVWT